MSDTENTQVDGKSLDEWFDARFQEKMAELEAEKVPMLSMLVSKGTLD